MEVSYTNHIGRSSRDAHSGKNTAISSISDLAATEKHNNHDYTQTDVDHMQSAIDLDHKHLNRQYEMIDGELVEVEGHLDLEARVRKIYDEQFAEAVAEYNLRQVAAGHAERQVASYIDKVSNDKQQEVAVEGLLQIGSLEDWEDRSIEDRQRAGQILLLGLKASVDELKGSDREFIIAGVSLHLNEGSPHLHYVGIPVQETPNAKNGMKKRVKKAAVFTKDSLGTGLQDNVRAKLAPMIKESFGWEFEQKKSGRNEDLSKNRYVNAKLQEQIREGEQRLNDIELAMHAAMNELEQNLQKQAWETAMAAASDHGGAYSDALFLLDACTDERFNELSEEGRNLKRTLLGEIAPAASPMDSLDERIRGIASGKIRPRELTWEERLAIWAKYSQMSNEYWRWRKDLEARYEYMRKQKYDERWRTRTAYDDAMNMLHNSRDIVTTIIAAAWALHEIKKERLINQQISEIREHRAIVAKTTHDFGTFSAAYREDLKAGKLPCSDYMDKMSQAIETLDQEYLQFQRLSKKQHVRWDRPTDMYDR